MKQILFVGSFVSFCVGTVCFGFGYMRTRAYVFDDPLFSNVSWVLFAIGVGLLFLFLVEQEILPK